MAARRLLLAGSTGPERVPVRHDRDDADWFKPPHVRDEAGARERIAAQVAAGADVVIAPTWLTHRRALLPLGETRQARAWTAAAVRIAREGVEIGLERRQEALADVPEDDVRRSRPTPVVAASLPALDDDPDPGGGRMLPPEAATERDYRDQAGLIADAEPDAILAEGQGTLSGARTAVAEAASTGLPAWVATSTGSWGTGADPERGQLVRWLEVCDAAGAELALVAGEPGAVARMATADGIRWGGLVPMRAQAGGDTLGAGVQAWIDVGAEVVGLLDGATSAVVENAREIIDEAEQVEIAASVAAQGRWLRHVSEAAAIAPGGAALWLGREPGAPLPTGFEWLVVNPEEAARLPTDHYRLVIIEAAAEIADPGRLLEWGGILALQASGGIRGWAELRLLIVDDGEPPLATYRREA